MEEKKEEINFEEIMKKLESITAELEKGNLDLDDSVSKFEEGMMLSKKCNEILEKAQKRISILIQDGDTLTEENFTNNEE